MNRFGDAFRAVGAARPNWAITVAGLRSRLCERLHRPLHCRQRGPLRVPIHCPTCALLHSRDRANPIQIAARQSRILRDANPWCDLAFDLVHGALCFSTLKRRVG